MESWVTQRQDSCITKNPTLVQVLIHKMCIHGPEGIGGLVLCSRHDLDALEELCESCSLQEHPAPYKVVCYLLYLFVFHE